MYKFSEKYLRYKNDTKYHTKFDYSFTIRNQTKKLNLKQKFHL